MKASKLLAIVLAFVSFSANAALMDGQTVTFTWLFPNANSTYTNGNYVVGAGVEIPNGMCCGFEAAVDFSDNNILVDFHGQSSYTPASFNGFRITDTNDTIADFTSVTINGLTNMGGMDASRVSWDANNIWVNFQSLPFAPGMVASFDVNGGGAVPEPGSLAIFGLGLAGLAAVSRRRKSH